MKLKLTYSLRSPFARRIRLALARLQISFESDVIDVFAPPPHFLLENPLGRVPYLTVRDAAGSYILPDSSTILEFLHENYGDKIWPRTLPERAAVRLAAQWCEGLMEIVVGGLMSGKMDLESIVRVLSRLDQLGQNEKKFPFQISTLQLTQAGYDLITALQYLDIRVPTLEWRNEFSFLRGFLEVNQKRGDILSTEPPAPMPT